MESVSDPYCLDLLRESLEQGKALETRQIEWLFSEADRLLRVNRLLDAAQAKHDRIVADQKVDIFALQSELGDVQDQLARVEQDLAIYRYAATGKTQE
jgi:hypothetical protein